MAGKTVWVACKLPSGLHLDAADADTIPGVVPEDGKRVTLNGTNSQYQGPEGSKILMPGSHGYGKTEVDADFFNDWMARHKDFPAVKNGLIFALPSEGEVEKEAKSRAGVANGSEAVNPEKPAPGVTKAEK